MTAPRLGSPGWLAGGASRMGSARADNMDAWLALPEHGLVVLADGMGSTTRGGEAARLAVHTFAHLAVAGSTAALPDIVAAVQQQVVAEFGGAVLRGASTLCAALLREDRLTVVNVGDSRCYRLRGNVLHPLTVDHTVAAHLVAVGAAEPDSPLARRTVNHLRRYLGNPAGTVADIVEHDVAGGDIVLLSSDGLHTSLTEQQLIALLTAHRDPAAAARALVDAAGTAGGTDDATAVVCRPAG